ncbi:PQQ-binding-like beta-propeller repeat protein [Microbulbifer bruguierae]|uniref:PQQ-binding-like beta-propeller repeat protein n=1 Tax=Microbulbifer bruguierae TaxID=3029061 RepID=A0ABY8NBM1_9GAMM|nr:PQQ-binding-like beta-propeller repeat protein [Microbulbifer bruguierae]WGL16319.1 PQQ-binding-like beta-propeller repeat protein [Microbulbifer bruguierae]
MALISRFFLKRSLLLLSFTALCTVLSACGGGGGGSSDSNPNPPPPPPPEPQILSLTGYAVKGPLSSAQVGVYSVQFSNSELKGALLVNTTTGAIGDFSDTEFEDDGSEYFLVEVIAGAETTDISTGAPPIISSLKTLVSRDALGNEQPVYATVSTTLIVEMLRLQGGANDAAQLASRLAAYEGVVVTSLGFELLENISLFHDSPMVTDTAPASMATLNHRTVLEAQAALIWELAEESGLPVARVIELLAADLLDGEFDGLTSLTNTDLQSGSQTVFELAAQQVIADLPIPQSSNKREPGEGDFRVGETVQLLLAESAETAIAADMTALEELPGYVTISAIGPDLDGDGRPDTVDKDIDGDMVLNIADAFPRDPTETLDSDDDGVGNNSDAFPYDSKCSLVEHGDGGECYLTKLDRLDLVEAIAGEGTSMYLVASGDQVSAMFRWDFASQQIDRKIDLAVAGNMPQAVVYHEGHQRIYVAYASGEIRYLDSEDPQQLIVLTDIGFPLEHLTSAGNYLFVLGDDDMGTTNLTLSKTGQILDRKDYGDSSDTFAWSAGRERLYFLYGYSAPYRLGYLDVDQSSGEIGARGMYPYNYDFYPDGALVLLDNANRLVSGSGTQYLLNTLTQVSSFIGEFSLGIYDGSDLVTVASNADGEAEVTAYTSAMEPFQALGFPGAPQALVKGSQEFYLITRTAGGKYRFHRFAPDRDLDDDGIENTADHFPTDPAASVDSDGDGWPDAWNSGATAEDSTSNLALDAYPQDSACQETQDGVDGMCDVANSLVVSGADMSLVHNGVVYSLSMSEKTVFRWDIAAEKPLNPVLLANDLATERPVSMAISTSGELMIGTDEGRVYRFSGFVPLQSELVYRIAGENIALVSTDDELVVGETTDNNYRKFTFLNTGFESTYYFSVYGENTQLIYHAESDRIFWNQEYYGGNLRSGVITPENGYLDDSRSYDYDASGLPMFISVSGKGDRVLVGGDTIVRSLQQSPFENRLPLPEGWPAVSQQLYPLAAYWWESMAVVVFQRQSNLWAVAYDPELKTPLFTMDLGQLDARHVLQYEQGLVYLTAAAGAGMSYQTLPLLADADSDGLPLWWELQYALDDENPADAVEDTDADGLSNLNEFSASTSPLLADSDGDGLTDNDEVSLFETNPVSVDSDGDFLPDFWELETGSDPLNMEDMAGDLDGDGFSNYVEFVNGSDAADAASVPAGESRAYISFENGEVPPELKVYANAEQIAISSAYASDGSYSLSLSGDSVITWQRTFAPVELSFDLVSDCYQNYSKDVTVYLDGEQVFSGYPPQSKWGTHRLLMAAGDRELMIVIDSSDTSCALYLDNFSARPLQDAFDMGASFVAEFDNKVQFYDHEMNLLQEAAIPANAEYVESARDLAILDDGRVAVFNGTFEPVLSIYSPRQHLWQHFAAPGWSIVNNGTFGGIDAIGERVFVTNMGTAGSPAQGLVVFDLAIGTFEFVDGDEYIDLTVGEDGYLYALSGSTVDKFDPDSLTVLSTITISGARAVAVNAAGETYAADWDGVVRKYDPFGNQLASLDIGGSFYDISLRKNGEILLSSRINDLVMTSEALTDFVSLGAYAEFVDFTPYRDSDNDGLPDWWEVANGLDAHSADDADSDTDGDNLTAAEEFVLSTRANNADTDGDAVTDGDEVLVHGTDPLNPDSDGDGLKDGEELALGTDPGNVDSDGDGLGDREEANVYFTNPLSSDTDGDGMADSFETAYGLDALNDDAGSDADGDGLTNLEESILGSSPRLLDTDGDTLSDYQEYAVHKTSPLRKDSDGDVLRDDWEIAAGLDPNDPADAAGDPDADGFSTLEEFVAHTSPADGSDFPQPVEWGNAQGGPDHTGYTPWDLDAANFALRWSKTFADVQRLHPAAAGDGRVFVSSDSYFGNQRIYGLDAASGDILWEKAYDEIHSLNPPSFASGKVYFQSGGHEDSFIRGLDAATGALVFASSYSNQWSNYLAPTVFDGQLYMAGGYYGGMYSHNGESGELNWFTNTTQNDGFTPAVDEEYVYVFINDLAAYHRPSGELAYRIDVPAIDYFSYDVNLATVLTGLGNAVATATQSGGLMVFDLANKSVLWAKWGGYRGQPSSHLGQIFVLESGILKVLDESSGEILWSYEASEPLTSNIVVTRTHIFVGGATTTFAIDKGSRSAVWSHAASGKLSLSDEGVLYIAGTALTAIDLVE